ncbi:hypothetical protein PHLGIDRAFT_119654 [Phlebiopsis gigantea 11061_1 CR5-6]|uniref:Uncharacterized protein n=1 Tax=Phlebiopsis gigantea (strain 11061_1 CR5-6) TaxID=745531 RepID=A0A0C3S8T7_PHLG1|nr:hypothetical protein PHLGIDRAFT_119654 [Phlebiopsis gigantea 11061_1 CR5-6]
MESLTTFELKVPGPGDQVTFSWMDAIEEVSIGGNETIKILFKECDQYPDVPYVQLPYGGATILWKEMRARTIDPGAEALRAADKKIAKDALPCAVWDIPRSKPAIFTPLATRLSSEGDWYKAAWCEALRDTAKESVKHVPTVTTTKFDVKSRYFTPSTGKYQLFVVPHVDWEKNGLSATRDIFVACVKSALGGSNGRAGIACDVAMPPADATPAQLAGRAALDVAQVLAWAKRPDNPVTTTVLLGAVAKRNVGILKLSSHPLGLYSTWIPVDHLGALIDETTQGAGSWARPRPDAPQVGLWDQTLCDYGILARNRVMGLQPEELPLIPGEKDLAEKRRTTASVMGDSANQKVGDRFSNMIFGTSECNTHMMRAEATIRSLLRNPNQVAQICLETVSVEQDLWMVDKVENGVVKVVDVPERPWRSVNGADYRWITLQLQYTIHYQTQFTSDVFHSATIFKPFSRYKPFYFEVDLDELVLGEYFKQPIFTGTREPDWRQVLNEKYLDVYGPDPHPETLIISGKRTRGRALEQTAKTGKTTKDPAGKIAEEAPEATKTTSVDPMKRLKTF